MTHFQDQRGDRSKLHTMVTKTYNSQNKTETKPAMKGTAQYAVKSMIMKTASITCNRRYRKETSSFLRKNNVMVASKK